jgi:o-succinylbenzoate synthase
MRIKKVDVYPVVFARSEPLRIAYGTSLNEPNVFVRLVTSSGTTGWGNGAPSSVTRETNETITETLHAISKFLPATEFDSPEEINRLMDRKIRGNTAAKAAVDIALYDIASKEAGLPLYKFLGAQKDKIETDMTIGIMSPKATLEHAVMYCRRGFRALNLKVGNDMKLDIKRIESVREIVGSRIHLRVDANQGYTADEAVEFARQIEPQHIEFIEQPVRSDDLEALKAVTGKSPIPIAADEPMHNSSDAKKLIDGNYADMLNIKLMKCAGITDALRIGRLADKKRIKLKIGCMGESKLSNTAGLHFALSQKQVCYADLDSWFTIVNDRASRGMNFSRGCLVPVKNSVGLGTNVRIKNSKYSKL